MVSAIKRTSRPVALASDIGVVEPASRVSGQQAVHYPSIDPAIGVPRGLQLDSHEPLRGVVTDTADEAAAGCVGAFKSGEIEWARTVFDADGLRASLRTGQNRKSQNQ